MAAYPNQATQEAASLGRRDCFMDEPILDRHPMDETILPNEPEDDVTNATTATPTG